MSLCRSDNISPLISNPDSVFALSDLSRKFSIIPILIQRKCQLRKSFDQISSGEPPGSGQIFSGLSVAGSCDSVLLVAGVAEGLCF